MTQQSRPTRLPARLVARLVAVAILLATANLHADAPTPVALRGTSEVPPVATAATGMATISVLSSRSVSGSIETSGIVPTIAHIHEAPIGKNGPSIITLIRKGDDGFTVPDEAMLSEAQYASYLAGNLYVNVHSESFPSGEIRAQLPGRPTRMAY